MRWEVATANGNSLAIASSRRQRKTADCSQAVSFSMQLLAESLTALPAVGFGRRTGSTNASGGIYSG
jgi:hypothetical protein